MSLIIFRRKANENIEETSLENRSYLGDRFIHHNIQNNCCHTMNINYSFGYYGQVAHSSDQDADWDFVTDYIDLGWPILLGINSTVSTFYPGGHMNIIFGYNNISGIRNGQPENYSFIKIYDALANGGKRYVCWDMLTYYEWDSTNLTGINREMFAFCPYR